MYFKIKQYKNANIAIFVLHGKTRSKKAISIHSTSISDVNGILIEHIGFHFCNNDAHCKRKTHFTTINYQI